MGKSFVKTITTENIIKNNPQLCLSPKRFLKTCHNCERFKKAFSKFKDIELTIQKLKCHPQIHENYISLLKKKRELLEQLKIINKLLKS